MKLYCVRFDESYELSLVPFKSLVVKAEELYNHGDWSIYKVWSEHDLDAIFDQMPAVLDYTVAEVEDEWDDGEEAEWESKLYIKDILLSEYEPHQTDAGASGMAYTRGDKLAIFFDPSVEEFGYCFYGVGDGGNAYESDDVVGFSTPEGAEAEALFVVVLSEDD